jgi:TRAP transporter 4TM/12TM fusion protein
MGVIMRKLTGFPKHLISILSVSLVLFHLYTSGFGMLGDLKQRSVHLFFVLTLCFMLKPARKGKTLDKVPFYDWILVLLSALSMGYILFIYDQIIWNPLQWVGTLDIFCSVIAVLLILEASRRCVGLTFPIFAVFFMIYAYFGEYFPGAWAHQRFTFTYIFQVLYHSTNGVWGTMVGIAATMLAMFGIFGATLSVSGGSQTFIKIGEKITGKSVGGPGKVALIASGLFGMISGSAMGNVVATGTFTIPMMKKARYTNEWAAAISAVGSTGGQLMPPIMGAAAFIMAQLTGIEYLSIAKAAIVPALLYYTGAMVAVHFLSLKDNIRGEEHKVNFTFGEIAVIVVPLTIFIGLLVNGYPVTNAAFYATIGSYITFTIVKSPKKSREESFVKTIGKFSHEVSLNSAGSILTMASLLGGAQVTISLISMTGFGIKLSDLIISIGQSNLLLSLILAMIVCIILGMGLPTTAAYVLSASILAPAIISLGVPTMSAHLFVMYFATVATITPPVCAAIFLSAGMAKADWLKAGWLGILLAIPAFVVPYTFAYDTSLLLIGSTGSIVWGVITAFMGVFFLGISVAGFLKSQMNMATRIIMFIGGGAMLIPNVLISIVGFTMAFCIAVYSIKVPVLDRKKLQGEI